MRPRITSTTIWPVGVGRASRGPMGAVGSTVTTGRLARSAARSWRTLDAWYPWPPSDLGPIALGREPPAAQRPDGAGARGHHRTSTPASRAASSRLRVPVTLTAPICRRSRGANE